MEKGNLADALMLVVLVVLGLLAVLVAVLVLSLIFGFAVDHVGNGALVIDAVAIVIAGGLIAAAVYAKKKA